MRALAVLPHSDEVVSIGEDPTLRLWEASPSNTQLLITATPHQAAPQWLACSSDGMHCLSGTGNRHVVSWNLQDSTSTVSLPDQMGSRTKCMAFNAAGTIVAIVLFDSSVQIYDLRSGECLASLMKRGERDASRVHSGGVNAVYLTASGSTALTVSKDCTARLWDVETASCAMVLEVSVYTATTAVHTWHMGCYLQLQHRSQSCNMPTARLLFKLRPLGLVCVPLGLVCV